MPLQSKANFLLIFSPCRITKTFAGPLAFEFLKNAPPELLVKASFLALCSFCEL